MNSLEISKDQLSLSLKIVWSWEIQEIIITLKFHRKEKKYKMIKKIIEETPSQKNKDKKAMKPKLQKSRYMNQCYRIDKNEPKKELFDS
mgnify:CR=1 FL=1